MTPLRAVFGEVELCNIIVWLEYCKACDRKHYMTMQPCPSCSGRGGSFGQPKSEKVWEQCRGIEECEGCEAYREHTNPY